MAIVLGEYELTTDSIELDIENQSKHDLDGGNWNLHLEKM